MSSRSLGKNLFQIRARLPRGSDGSRSSGRRELRIRRCAGGYVLAPHRLVGERPGPA
jgi:hypothetical protein